MKKIIGIIVAIAIGLILGIFWTTSSNEDLQKAYQAGLNSRVVPVKEISVLAEERDCKDKGGKFELKPMFWNPSEEEIRTKNYKDRPSFSITCHAPPQPDIFNYEIKTY